MDQTRCGTTSCARWLSHLYSYQLFLQYNCINCVKSVRLQSYSGSYSVRMRKNAEQNNSEYGHFLRSVTIAFYNLKTYEIVVTKKRRRTRRKEVRFIFEVL